eukprot:336130_1
MSQTFTSVADVAAAQAADDKKCLIVVDGDVYDAKDFLFEHPGGGDAITDLKGQDATEAFDAVGHTDEARKMLDPMKVGSVTSVISQRKTTKPKETSG